VQGDDRDHGGEAHLEARSGERFRPDEENHECGNGHHPQRKRLAPQRQGQQHQHRPDATAHGRHLGSGEERIGDARKRSHARGDERQAHAQGEPRPKRKQLDGQEIGRRDHCTDMQAADREQMGKPRIAHRLFVGLGDGSAVAARQGGGDGSRRAVQLGAHMRGKRALHSRHASPAGRGLQHRHLALHASGRRQPLEPGCAGKVVRTRQHRRRGWHQPQLQTKQRAFADLRAVLLNRQIDADLDRLSAVRAAACHDQAHTPFGRLFDPLDHAAFDSGAERPGDRLRPDQRGFGPDYRDAAGNQQADCDACHAQVSAAILATP